MPPTLANPQTARRSPELVTSARNQARRTLNAPFPLRIWHLASLDAPTVAVVWTLAFAWTARVSIPFWVPALLALVTWAVYVLDRLLDARSVFREAHINRLQERHRFHWRHRRILFPLAVAAACTASWIVFFLLPIAARQRDSVLAAAALAYFIPVHFLHRLPSFPLRLLSKELLVGLLFTAACVLPSLSRISPASNSPRWPLFLVTVPFFVALAWLNCHSIDRWESNDSSPRNDQVFATAVTIGLSGLIAAAFVFHIQPRSSALIATGAAAALLLAFLDRISDRLTPLALRTAADLVLLSPVLLTPVLLLLP